MTKTLIWRLCCRLAVPERADRHPAVLSTRAGVTSTSLLAVFLGLTACSEPAPMPPVALAAPKRSNVPAARDWMFMAFFDQHSYRIDAPRKEKALADIARAFVRHHVSSLELFGYTDESETKDLHLGARRAQAVRVFLAESGIAPESIKIHDFGASRPLVPTELGAAEPQNRRVEFRPDLHSSDEELQRKHQCEAWLQQHAAECDQATRIGNVEQACAATKHALSHWYLPD